MFSFLFIWNFILSEWPKIQQCCLNNVYVYVVVPLFFFVYYPTIAIPAQLLALDVSDIFTTIYDAWRILGRWLLGVFMSFKISVLPSL
jgi:hypothetical protein